MRNTWLRYGVAAVVGNMVLAFSPVRAESVTAEMVTIVALGDSLVAGYGLPQQDGFVPQMQAWLDANGTDAVIVNAGVSGDTTAGGLARIDWALGEDVDALIVSLGGNDYLRAIDPANSRENLAGILDVAEARDLPVLLVGIEAGTNYGPDFASDFNEMYIDLAAEYGTGLRADFFAGLQDEQAAGDLEDFMQDDGIHPNAQGVRQIVDELGPDVAALAERAAVEE